MTDVSQKGALLLHTAGIDMQDIFFSLETVGENTDDDYVKKVQVGKDQEKAQSEKDSHSKNRGGKKPN